MSEAGQETRSKAGSAHRSEIDAICDFVRRTLEEASDAITPPAEAMNHFREARVEFLRGVRSLIDHRIDHLSRKGHNGGARVVVE